MGLGSGTLPLEFGAGSFSNSPSPPPGSTDQKTESPRLVTFPNFPHREFTAELMSPFNSDVVLEKPRSLLTHTELTRRRTSPSSAGAHPCITSPVTTARHTHELYQVTDLHGQCSSFLHTACLIWSMLIFLQIQVTTLSYRKFKGWDFNTHEHIT